MEKKKLKLSISGSQKRTMSSIEQAKSQSKNTVVIEKRSGKIHRKQPQNKFLRNNNFQKNSYVNSASKPPPVFQQNTKSDFEKRKLAEQRATKRLKGERIKIKGYLEDFALSKNEADILIMSAREKIFKKD